LADNGTPDTVAVHRGWRPSGRQLVTFAAIVVLVGFSTFAVVRARQPSVPNYTETPTPSQLPLHVVAPPFDLARLGGGARVSLAADAKRPVVINFFASWCANCRQELGALATAAKTHPGVAFIGVDTNDTATATARHLAAAAGITYPIGIDTTAATGTAYLVAELPVTFVVDRTGHVAEKLFGAQTTASLARALRAVAAKS
jgi:cytochrome c biogenesis protein CcmG/thiol:disulfide interchange protein DsbE